VSDAAAPPSALPAPVVVLGHRVHPVDLDTAASWTLAAATSGGGARLVVTLNPEIVVRSRHDARLAAALAGADLTVADGVGVVWAARRAGHALPGRVPGVELVERVLERGGGALSVVLPWRAAGGGRAGSHHRRGALGRPGRGRAARVLRPRGRGRRRRPPRRRSGANLLLAGLGERQESFLAAHRERLGAAVAIGVGGTLDVLAGAVRRTPGWTRRLGLEWAWRVGSTRSAGTACRASCSSRCWRCARLASRRSERSRPRWSAQGQLLEALLLGRIARVPRGVAPVEAGEAGAASPIARARPCSEM
jgi:N-acetylglucosaminyldiphosphoundecaprenol N-acetyl-beta-D-mannosaminyltransferase